ncbi:XdhC family protein [Actinokineospora iranica]|nr:XdhC family protein [Actinokineospora iranica]
MSTDSRTMAHGAPTSGTAVKTLVVVFATAVGEYLLRYGADLGYKTLLVEPQRARVAATDVTVLTGVPADLGEHADLVVTDHHRPELGALVQSALRSNARWIGVMGNPRHPPPHVPALRALGVPESDIARVHRPIGLNIGSRTPPEIAIATLAGLIADRNGKPGGFEF